MMEFFEYFDMTILFNGVLPVRFALWVAISLAVVFVILFIFRGIGLHSIAKRERHNHSWFAFVPFLNDYLMGELSGGVYFSRKKIKHFSVFFAVADVVACAAYVLSDVAQLALIYGGAEYDLNSGSFLKIPDTLGWAYYMDEAMSYILPITILVYTFFFVMAVFAFFRRYAARNALIFSIASVFLPIQGVLIFAVRKNLPVDYANYMRARQEAQRRRYQEDFRRYEANDRNASSESARDKKGDPFGEFSRNDAKGDKENGASEFPENDEFFR